MKIFFLIRSLNAGGAERQLVTLAKHMAQLKYQVSIAVFYGGGVYEEDLADADVKLLNLQKRGRWDIVGFMSRLIGMLREENPDVIYSFMSVPNILTILVRHFVHAKVICGVRSSNVDLSRYDWLARWTYRCERVLSRYPDAIVVNSRAGMRYRGLEGKRNVVFIPNGIDTISFSPDLAAGRDVRKAWGVGEEEYLVGLVGRLDPMKDHPTFLKAASGMIRRHGNVKFVCVGDGPEPYKSELKDLARTLGLEESLIWAGGRRDMSAVYNALDLATLSSSYGEGFPNAVGEAMACGTPCVVTDVGDCAEIVGDTGHVVPPKDPVALARGWEKLFSLPLEKRMELGEKARQRIIKRFSLEKMVKRHEELFEENTETG